MGIPEPVSDLWTAVRPHTEWPVTDEVVMQDIAQGWTAAGTAFMGSSSPRDNGLTDGWGDAAGALYRDKLAEIRSFFRYDGEAMKYLALLAREFGNDVGYAKTEIRDVIADNEGPYADLKLFFGLFEDTTAQQVMVNEVANAINAFLAQMADRIAARNRGAPELDRAAFTGRSVVPDAGPADVEPGPTDRALPPGYTWAPPHAPTDVLEPEQRWNPDKGTPVLGRLPDTTFVGQWPGHTYLSIPDWTPAKNDAYIQTIIDGGGSVYVASPLEGNGWQAQRPSVLAREVRQLLQAGYTWSGNYLVPGGER